MPYKKFHKVKKEKPLKKKVAKLEKDMSNINKIDISHSIVKNDGVVTVNAGGNSGSTLLTANVVNYICTNSMGSAIYPLDNNRLTNRVRSKYINLEYTFYTNLNSTWALAGNTSVKCRLVVVKSRGLAGGYFQPNGNTAPTTSSMFLMNNSSSLSATEQFQDKLFVNSTDNNFHVLFDKTVMIGVPPVITTDCSNIAHTFKKRIKADHMVEYSGVGSNAGDVIAGQMFVLAFCDNSLTNPTISPGIRGTCVWEYETI